MLDRLILAGCDVNATLVMNNLVLNGLHWAAETHPRVVASLISSRLNPNDQVEKTKQENHKFGVSFADNYSKFLYCTDCTMYNLYIRYIVHMSSSDSRL